MKIVKLSGNNTYEYLLRSLTEIQMNEVMEYLEIKDENILKELIFLKDENIEIIAAGETNEGLNKTILKEIIPNETKLRRGASRSEDETLIEYKCFASNKKNLYNNIQIHEDIMSSFKCALNSIGNPKFALITIERLKEEINIIEDEQLTN